jgi:hypothetical protein
MPAAGPQLTLLVPGLLGSAHDPNPGHGDRGGPRLPALEALLARSERAAGAYQGLEATLFDLFAADTEQGADLPVAAVTRVLDLGVIDKGWWLRADPVHLVPDRDRLILTDASRLDIRPEEAQALAGEIAEVYTAEGWVLKAPRPGRWYLKPPRAPRLLTTPLADVIGRDIHPYLPQGKDGKAWHTILTEMQILLHTAKANESREQQGKPPINSLWFWGGGRLPALGAHPFVRVWSDEPLGLAFARLSQTPSEGLPAGFTDWQQRARHDGEHLLVLDGLRLLAHCGDAGEWRNLLEALERNWFAPLLDSLKRGALTGARILTDRATRFRLTPRGARRWWRRRRPIALYR